MSSAGETCRPLEERGADGKYVSEDSMGDESDCVRTSCSIAYLDGVLREPLRATLAIVEAPIVYAVS